MTVRRVTLLIAILSVCPLRSSLGITLTFDSPVPGTILDSAGLGTGFTHRLPGTGATLPADDPNMTLRTETGELDLRSTNADINGGGINLGQLEAPGFLLPNVGSVDVSLSAEFRNVRVTGLSDQLLLYFGDSASNVVRAGMHESNVYLIIANRGAFDTFPFASGTDAFTTGDDIVLNFGRSNGLWQLSWQNLTNPTKSGASPQVSIPWLDAINDLYAGVMACNARSGTSFTASLHSVTAVPEPSTWVMVAGGIACVSWGVWRRRKRA